jgi:hypothetical protein
MHWPLFISPHTYADVIDHVEPKPMELPEQAQAKDTNIDPEQGKPQCI